MEFTAKHPARAESLAAMPRDRKFKGQIDHYFSSQKPWFSLSKKIWNPPTDIYETKDKLIIKMEVAGVNEERLEISLQENLLAIRGLRIAEDVEELNIHLLEIHYGQFERIFQLPDNIRVNEIRATYAEGFLRVVIEKEQLDTKPLKITVNEESGD